MSENNQPISLQITNDGTHHAIIDGIGYVAQDRKTLIRGLKHHFGADSNRIAEIEVFEDIAQIEQRERRAEEKREK